MKPLRKRGEFAKALQDSITRFTPTSSPTRQQLLLWRDAWENDQKLTRGEYQLLTKIKDYCFYRKNKTRHLEFTSGWFGKHTKVTPRCIRNYTRGCEMKGYILKVQNYNQSDGQKGNYYILTLPGLPVPEGLLNALAQKAKTDFDSFDECLSAPPEKISAPPEKISAPPEKISALKELKAKEQKGRNETKAASRAGARKPAAPQGGNFSASPEQARLVALWNANINAMVRNVPCPATELTARDIQSLQVEHACAAVRIFVDRCDQRRGSDLGKDRIQNPIAYLFKPSGRTQQEIYSEKGRYKEQLWTIERLEEYCEHRFGKLAPRSQPATTASVVEGVQGGPNNIVDDETSPTAIVGEEPEWKSATTPQGLAQASSDQKRAEPCKGEQATPQRPQRSRPLPIRSDLISPLARKLSNTSRSGAEQITLDDVWGEMKRVSGRGPRAYRLIVDGLAVLSGNVALIATYKRRLDFERDEEAMREWVEKKIAGVEKSLAAPEPENITPFNEVLERASRKPALEVSQSKGAPKVRTPAPKKNPSPRLPTSSRADLLERAKGFDGRFDEVLLKEVLLGLSPIKAAEWGLETHKKSFSEKSPINARYWQWAKGQVEGNQAE